MEQLEEGPRHAERIPHEGEPCKRCTNCAVTNSPSIQSGVPTFDRDGEVELGGSGPTRLPSSSCVRMFSTASGQGSEPDASRSCAWGPGGVWLCHSSTRSSPGSWGEVLSVEELQQRLVRCFTASYNFSFILATKLREASSEAFPKLLPLHEMLRMFLGRVVERTVSLDMACQGGLCAGLPAIAGSTPGATRRPQEVSSAPTGASGTSSSTSCHGPGARQDASSQAPNINLLYLGASVLILWDYDYLGPLH